MRILFIGDIIGRAGRNAVKKYLAANSYDFVVANGENSAAGYGITDDIYRELLGYGVSVITGGNHTWDKTGTDKEITKWDKFVRPLNYPQGSPGMGYFIKNDTDKILVTSLLGRVFMQPYDDPFKAFDKLYEEFSDHFIIVDFHAEATSEKNAFGLYVDSKAGAVIGTHTHVQTNDLRLLPSGNTLYLTDAGMCGSLDSVIGMEKTSAINRFTTCFNKRVEPEQKGRICFCGVEFSINSHRKIISHRLIQTVEKVVY